MLFCLPRGACWDLESQWTHQNTLNCYCVFHVERVEIKLICCHCYHRRNCCTILVHENEGIQKWVCGGNLFVSWYFTTKINKNKKRFLNNESCRLLILRADRCRFYHSIINTTNAWTKNDPKKLYNRWSNGKNLRLKNLFFSWSQIWVMWLLI